MKILIPNPFGFPRPSREAIAGLRRDYGGSEAYAAFLAVQNGLEVDRLAMSGARDAYLSEIEGDSDEGRPDLRVLYGLDSGRPYHELRKALSDWLFTPYFLPIGEGYGGNVYVEILKGEHHGSIASLNHEYYLGGNLDDFLAAAKLDGFAAADDDARADMLSSERVGLAWRHAPSLTVFLDSCLRFADGRGYVVDALAGERSATLKAAGGS